MIIKVHGNIDIMNEDCEYTHHITISSPIEVELEDIFDVGGAHEKATEIAEKLWDEAFSNLGQVCIDEIWT